jgi:small subunit ribosomal protein S9
MSVVKKKISPIVKPHTGRRKTAIARVWLKPGSGKIVVNGQSYEEYFGQQFFSVDLGLPFEITKTTDQYDVICTVKGSGKASQLGAIRLGIARCLVNIDEDFRKPLKTESLLTRDSRMVERKKYGKRKARRSRQFSKR